ncbi:MAG: MFS transporter [Vampirovibrionales bacterium]
MALPPTPSPASSASPAEVCRESSKIQEELSSVSPSQSSLLTNALCTKAHPWRVAIGFLGIQFAWALQMGQVSPLLERLGSQPWLTSLIWAAGPVTGVLVQPIVGALSDATTSWLGRRRPFLILGTVLVALSLMMMPNAAIVGAWLQQVATPLTRLGFITPQAWEQFPFGLLVAAMLLWVLDASINITQATLSAGFRCI